MTDCSMHPDSVGEIIHRACNEEQSIPDLSLGNQFANTISMAVKPLAVAEERRDKARREGTSSMPKARWVLEEEAS